MYNISVQVEVKAIEENKRILIEWRSGNETLTAVEWIFTLQADNTTFVSIINSSYSAAVVKQALVPLVDLQSCSAGLKAFLEHGIISNLILDHFPKNLWKH